MVNKYLIDLLPPKSENLKTTIILLVLVLVDVITVQALRTACDLPM